MVLNSIFLYSHNGYTLAMRDYNPGESTVEISKNFVRNHLKNELKKHEELKNKMGTDLSKTTGEVELSETAQKEGLPVISITGTDYYAVYLVKDEVVYTAFTKSDAHLLVVIQYLRVLIETIEETIKKDLVHEIPKRPEVHYVLDLLVDFSIPLLPSKNILMTFLQKEGLWAKSTRLLAKEVVPLHERVLGRAIEEARTNEEAFWKPHIDDLVTYSGECLFDHDEIFTGIIDDEGVVQTCEVMGKVNVWNKNSLVQNITFALKHPQKIESYSLHACARNSRKRFEKSDILTFTPGINDFTVVKYICNPFTCTLPFELEPKIKINDDNRTVKVRMFLKSQEVAGQHLKVTDFVANIHFPKYLNSSSIAPTDKNSEFVLNEDSNIGKWTIGKLKPKSDYELEGNFYLPNDFLTEDEEIDVVINLNFNIQSYIISSARIENIQLRDKTHPVDMTRGVKSTTRVKDLEMRITVKN